MATKTFNTRIKLRIDTLENWNKSTVTLLPGEIAFASVAANEGLGLTEPVIMAKIATEEGKTFAELPWAFHAKSSDVLAACKSTDALTAFVNNVIANAGIASSEAMTALTGRVTTAENEIDTLQTEMDAVEAKAAANETAIGTLNGLVGDIAVATQITNAIAAALQVEGEEKYALAAHTHEIAEVTGLQDAIADAKKAGTDANGALEAYKTTNDAAVQEVAGDLAAEVQRATGIEGGLETRLQAVEAKFGDGEGNVEAQIAAAVAAEAQIARAAEEANANAIDAIEADYLKTADKTALQEQITANDGEILALQGLVGDTKVSTAIESAVKEEADRAKGIEGGLETRLKAVEDDYLKAADKTELTNAIATAKQEAVATVLGEGTSEDFDTLKEVADWILSDTTGAAALQTDVANIKKDYLKAADKTELEGKITTAQNAADKAQGEVDALEGVVATKAAQTDHEALAGKVTTVEGKVSTLESEMDAAQADISALEGLVGGETVAKQISDAIAAEDLAQYALATELDTAEGKIEALEADTHTHANKVELDKIAEGDKAKWDAKVDSITAVQNGGIKATRTDNAITLELDDTITYVFNCGTSAE